MDTWFVILVGARLALLVLGATTTAISFRAYRRERTSHLRTATLAFGVITAGVLVEGVLYQFTSLTLEQVHVVESITVGMGLALLLWSFVE